MRKSRIFLVFTFAEILVLCALCLWSSRVVPARDRRLTEAKRELVVALSLTDFAIWTEARYTRHPSQADFFSPFQDAPSSFEHFPAGSIVAPVAATGDDP
jgi:hypothetical protein